MSAELSTPLWQRRRYQDDGGATQGPFSTVALALWALQGWLPAGFLVQHAPSLSWAPIALLLQMFPDASAAAR